MIYTAYTTSISPRPRSPLWAQTDAAVVTATPGDGPSAIEVVGGSALAQRETAARVRFALAASGYLAPRWRVVVRLADLTGASVEPLPHHDLAVALAVLAADEQIDAARLDRYTLVGELSLSGRPRLAWGSLLLSTAPAARPAILPAGSPCLPGVLAYGARDLREVSDVIEGRCPPLALTPLADADLPGDEPEVPEIPGELDAADARVREAVEGGAGVVVLVGEPGSGKTLLARRVVAHMPPLARGAVHRIAATYDAVGLAIPSARPFRAPHHTVSVSGMVGTRRWAGEVALARDGVLLLDEAAEFAASVLDGVGVALRSGWAPVVLVVAVDDGDAAERVLARLGNPEAVTVPLSRLPRRTRRA